MHAIARLDILQAEAEKDILAPSAAHAARRRPSALEGVLLVFRPEYRARTMLALFVLGMVQLSGIDGVLYVSHPLLSSSPSQQALTPVQYAPILFHQAGLPSATAGFLASGLSAILMLLISIPALLYADRVGRRLSTLIGGAILAACMLIIGLLYATASVHTYGPARWLVVVLIFVFALTYCATWAVVGKLYAAEIQPARTRASANCIAQGLGFVSHNPSCGVAEDMDRI